MTLYLLALWGGIAACCSFLLTKFMIRINIQDVPNNRSSHIKVTPKSGGIAVAVPFLGALFLYNTFFSFSLPFITPILIASMIIVIMGVWDDMKGLSWRVRLGFQGSVALFVVGSGLYFKTLFLPYFGVVPLGIWGGVLSGLGIVAFMNFYNFMDGLNGITIGSTLIALFFYGIMVLGLNFENQSSLTFFCIFFLILTLLPIFFFNFPDGKIFLGDAGSQFLGLILFLIGVLGTSEFPEIFQNNGQEIAGISPFLIPLLFFNFIFDGLLTLILRALRGRKIWEADRNHLFHMLLDKKISAEKVSYIHFIFFTIQGIVAFYFTFYVSLRFFILGLGLILSLHIFYAYWLLQKPQLKRGSHA